MDITIRPETNADTATIEAVTVAAFLNAEHTSHTEQLIVDGLRRAGALTVSLVAEDHGEIVGHVAASPVVISDGTAGWYGLGPLSVKPECQKRGIGSKLVQEALDRLRELGASGCVVLGDLRYYERFGFRAEAGLILPDVPHEYFMAVAFSTSLPHGIVTYHEAFNA
ncbi:MAG: N-acetyltransferase [Verrucomicrobiaceae bacterium]|nr:N-acetyltransferase [Verrucomicrobiaceae bacterium]